MKAAVRRFSFHPSVLDKAFFDPSHAPREFGEMLASGPSALASMFSDLLIAGDGPPTPEVPALLLWGKEDRSPGTSEKDALRLGAKLTNATLRMIPNAGHFPQLEAPEEFVQQATRWFDEAERRPIDAKQGP